MSAFEELGLCPEIIRAIEEDDWLLPTPVQQEAVPLILTGGDVLAAAETGSGKTGAFGLPCLQIVHETLRGTCQTRDATGSNMRCVLNPADKDLAVVLQGDGLECRGPGTDRWTGARATAEVIGGKYMFEVEVIKGLTRVGWSSAFANLELGTEHKSMGYGSTGKKSVNKQFSDYGDQYENGDIIGCLIDRDDQTISFAKNGRSLGVAFDLPEDLHKTGLKPHVCGKGFHVALKFDGPMEYPVKGYAPIGDLDPEHAGNTKAPVGNRAPMCVVLEPTRDLAEQTYKCFEKFSKYLQDPPLKLALLVGGIDDAEQARTLKGGVDICVGTLQKTMDHLRKNNLSVTDTRFLVLDEADDLQKKDEKGDIKQLNQTIKGGRKDRVQTLFFSATLHTPEVRTLIDEITTNAVWVDLKGKDAVPDTVHHVIFKLDPARELEWSGEQIAVHAKAPGAKPKTDGVHEKPSMSAFDSADDRQEASRISERNKQMKPQVLVKIADTFKMTQCLIFCRTNIDCNNLENYLNRLGGAQAGFRGKMESGKENPYSCVVLAGARLQKERQRNLEAFKDGDVRFMICTDVAARGIDVAGLPFVIQLTLPDDIENYIHRIGRCGRAERLGMAISIVSTKREKVWYHKCPTRGKNCMPPPGNTKLTMPFGPDGKNGPVNEQRWHIDEGGCCIWYDETDLLQQIETRVGQPIPVMDPEDFSVEGIIDSPLEGAKKKSEANKEPLSRRQQKRKAAAPKAITGMIYGAKRNDLAVSSNAQQVSAIGATVLELAILETQIQDMFSKVRWGNGGADSAPTPAPADVVMTTATPGPVSAATKPAAAGAPPKKKVRW
eukprot:TRINITY_DN101089_c0_g1_i1.p1 TRINITY_DN101089_c0_g1~~TRINITY_DN101089_c0_g1_i1.p1  ORF type:complete len:833 (-),score=257.16 TRINITY_DN101089_c0_g1_i1:120-2618(-)